MKFKAIISLSLFSLLSISFIAANGIKGNVPLVSYAFSNEDVKSYYQNINSSDEGTTLLQSLQALNKIKRRDQVGYGSMFSYFKLTDPGDSSGKIRSFYSGKSVSSSQCNREHVWPNSHGGDMVEDDIHMVRPALKDENEGRGNSFYVEGMNTQYDGWDPANEGVESYRGDSARIVFYCVVAYSGFQLLDVNKHHTTSENNDYMMGRLSHLLRWNLQYPVSSRERIRNDAAERIQGNKNPFIDHPEYACRIWGNYNNATKDICSHKDYEPVNIYNDVTDTAIPEEDTYEVGEGVYLAPYQSGTKLTNEDKVNWEILNFSSDTPLDNDKVVLKNYGDGTWYLSVKTEISFRVRLTITSVGSITKKFHFKGEITPDPEEQSQSGCSGNIVTTSTIISILSALGVSILLINRHRRINKNK